jgi:hypothetical protein
MGIAMLSTAMKQVQIVNEIICFGKGNWVIHATIVNVSGALVLYHQ